MLACALAGAVSLPAWADNSGQPAPAVTQVQGTASSPAASTPQPTAAAPSPVVLPAMSGPLTANPQPMSIDLGSYGPIYIGGAVSGLGLLQGNANPRGQLDLSNGQVISTMHTAP